MKVINYLIFNTLANHESINIPHIGSLRIERSMAQLKGKKRLEPPTTRVIYSKHEAEGAKSVIELIEQHSGADNTKAEKLYKKWLEEVCLERVLTIDGVGRVKNDFFNPSPELSMLLNPDSRTSIKLHKRVNRGAIIAAGVSVAIVAVAVYHITSTALMDGVFNCEVHSTRVEVAAPTGPIIILPDSVMQESTVVDSSAVNATDALQTTEQTPEIKARYHIIAGVYSSIENANKFIAKAKIDADTLPYKALPLANGKFLISIFESSTEQEAAVRKKILVKADSGLWIYKMP